jgi:CDP-diacylglycerol---serine O-phosphatidyltransferase
MLRRKERQGPRDEAVEGSIQARRLTRRRRMVAVLPSLLTLGNAVCGFAAITYAAKVGPEVELGPEAVMPRDLYFSALLIFGAMVFDVLDGPAARFMRQTSQFGAQLDSLADAISFGVAPAFLMLKFSPVLHPRVLWVIAVLYMLCAVLRLARFNVNQDDSPQHDTFRGLPSPAAAGTVASLVLIGPGLERWADPARSAALRRLAEFLITATSWALPVVTLVVACLMVSRIRYPHVFNQLFSNRHSYPNFVKLIFAIAAVLVIHELAIPLVLLSFVAASPLRATWSRLMHRVPDVPESAPAPPPTNPSPS